jgi:hypothetical protein
MANETYTVSKPNDWDKAVFAAYLRLIGETQKSAARIAGVGKRTLERWEMSEFWHDACEEAARDRWLKHLVTRARMSLTKNIDADGNLALKIVERMDERLLPPAQRLEHSGPQGGPLEVAVTRQVVPAKNRIAAELNGAGTNGDGRS